MAHLDGSHDMSTITPFLWFDTQAEEAMNFYASVFERTRMIAVNRAGGRVMSVQFELEGQRFIALNAGPMFKLTEAISFFVGCETQRVMSALLKMDKLDLQELQNAYDGG